MCYTEEQLNTNINRQVKIVCIFYSQIRIRTGRVISKFCVGLQIKYVYPKSSSKSIGILESISSA